MYLLISVALGLMVVLFVLARLPQWFGEENKNSPKIETVRDGQMTYATDAGETTRVRLVTNYGAFEVEVFTELMPITAGNFLELAKSGFYDNTKFHRVIDGFMIQGGDPLSKEDSQMERWGTGGSGVTIPDEHIAHPALTNIRGTLAMANSGPESGQSQFFINLADNTYLDFDKEPLANKHPVFGRVVSGMTVVDVIGKEPTTGAPSDRPLEPVVLERVIVRDDAPATNDTAASKPGVENAL